MQNVENLLSKGFERLEYTSGIFYGYKFVHNSDKNKVAYELLGVDDLGAYEYDEFDFPVVYIETKENSDFYQFITFDTEGTMLNHGEITEELFNDVVGLL